MSVNRPVYIPCASGNNPQTDCSVFQYGNLIRLLGHPQMDFTADDFAALCLYGLELARDCGWQDPEIDDGK